MSAPDPDAPRRWRERLWFARCVRFAVFLVPLVLSFVVAVWLSRALPVPDPLAPRVLRWVAIAAVSTVVLVALQRATRRFLPLSVLLSLTLVFPDEAPSRFRMALRSYSARDLERTLRTADGELADATAQQAAEELLVLVAALSRHDRMTRGHSERVRAYSLMIGEELGLTVHQLDRLRWAGLLHDIGKLKVPAEILNKPGRLTDDEFAIVRQHTTHGAALTAGLAGWLGTDVRATEQHHERWAGGGYPNGLRGEQIVRSARIVAVADAFDVMTSARSYKRPMAASAARAELERCAGSQFEPAAVRAMLSISLGRLWMTMGPLSWLAQLRLFPRQAAQAGTAVTTSMASMVAVAVTALASVVAGADPGVAAPARVASLAPVPAATSGTTIVAAPPTTPPSTTPPTVPPTTPPTVPPTTPPTVPPTTPPTTAPARPVAATVSTSTSPITVRLPEPVPTTTSTTTTTTTSTTTTTTTTTSTTTTTTTTTTSTTTTTTTVPPPPPIRFTLVSSGPGDTVSQPILDLAAAAAPQNATLPNYDTDRNADPGLTLIASNRVLRSPDPAARQVWRLPAELDAVPAGGSLTLWVAPLAAAPGDELHIRAGLFDCDAARVSCVRLIRDTLVVPAIDGFAPLVFDLSVGTAAPLAPGHRAELRVAVPSASDVDVWIAYDTVDHPAALTFAP